MVSLKELKRRTAKIVKRVVLSTASRRPKTKVLINPTTTQVKNAGEVEND